MPGITTLPDNPYSGTAPATGGSVSSSAEQVAAAVEPVIVDINTVTYQGQAAGTGMIIGSNGTILTNNHVVQGATSISVSIAGHSGTYAARVIGTDSADDVALIRVSGLTNLPTVSFADPAGITVGEDVIAIGNAYGQGGTPTVTEGTITALDQSITASDPGSPSQQLTGMLETDASISPGDSGGALVDSNGQVVGMITAGSTSGFRRRAAAASVGFAIPSSKLTSLSSQIESGQTGGGSITLGQPAYLGVQVSDAGNASGALVVGVVSGSPAASLGISANSLITAVGGHSVQSAASLGPIIRAYKPGTRVSVTWLDPSGASHTASVVLVAGPAA